MGDNASLRFHYPANGILNSVKLYNKFGNFSLTRINQSRQASRLQGFFKVFVQALSRVLAISAVFYKLDF